MENFVSLYNSINDNGVSNICQGREYIDTTIDSVNDTRMGLTLLIRPDEEVKQNLQKAISEIKLVEPDQYYYPPSDFHITLFSLISAVPDFVYSDNQKENCIELTRYAVKNHGPFEIDMRGLILSDACLIASGFPQDTINEIRQAIRDNITDYGLSLKERYPIKTAHITLGRFKQQLSKREDFLKKVMAFKNTDFGAFTVKEVELVYHNWFDSKKEILERFTL